MLASVVTRAGELLAVVLAAGIVAVWLLIRRQAGRLADPAERAYPAPLDSPPRGRETGASGRRRRGGGDGRG